MIRTLLKIRSLNSQTVATVAFVRQYFTHIFRHATVERQVGCYRTRRANTIAFKVK